MTGKSILDTNIVVRLLNGDPIVERRISALDQTYLPCVVVGELIFGAMKSGRVERNLERIEDFIATLIIVPVELETARIYGMLKQQSQEEGRPIPENDLWISAIAVQHAMTLISNDRHFEGLENLNLEQLS